MHATRNGRRFTRRMSLLGKSMVRSNRTEYTRIDRVESSTSIDILQVRWNTRRICNKRKKKHSISLHDSPRNRKARENSAEN